MSSSRADSTFAYQETRDTKNASNTDILDTRFYRLLEAISTRH